jgi:hypothetical protein
MFNISLRLERQQDGTLRLTGKNQGVKDGMFKPNDNKEAVDLSKMTDKELDEYLLRQRVEYQKGKPFLTMMFADLKIKLVIHLPGEVVQIKGLKKEGRTVTQSLEGKAFLEMFQKFVMLEAADVRKLATRGDPKDIMALMGPVEAFTDPDVTINQLKAQFDYDEEVRAARAAYPRLRKALSMSDDVPLPGETK